MTIISSAYYVPKARSCLLSPKRLFNAEQGVIGRFTIEEDNATLVFENVGEIVIDYDSRNHLPTGLGNNQTPGVAEVNLAGVLGENNSSLSPAKKLLHWHGCFVHKSMSRVQSFFRVVPFISERFKAANWILDLSFCETCQYAKAHQLLTKGSIQSPNPDTDEVIHDGQIRARNLVPVDHFES